MSCGNWCVYYSSRGNTSACSVCSDYEGGQNSRFDLGTIDPFKLAEGLARKKEEERRNKIPQLTSCIICLRVSLFYNKINDNFECLNQECELHVNHIVSGSKEYIEILRKIHPEDIEST